jgi:hypothetical protein
MKLFKFLIAICLFVLLLGILFIPAAGIFYAVENPNDMRNGLNNLAVHLCSAFNGEADCGGVSADTDMTVTRGEYDCLETGLSYDEVTNVLGRSGEEMSSSDLAGFTSTMYRWGNSDGSNIIAIFQNQRLITKAQSNLPTSGVDSTPKCDH